MVITPSTANEHLAQCIASVQRQSYGALEHIVIADGPDYSAAVARTVENATATKVPLHLVSLPQNTGGGGFNGYWICAAFSYLAAADVIFFLDDDNWYDDHHVAVAMAALDEHHVDWAFANRRICRSDGSPLVDDDCDSLGFWRRAAAYRGPTDRLAARFIHFYSAYPFLVDTNCYAIRKAVLCRFASTLLHKYHGDAVLATSLITALPGACTGGRTVNYRLKRENERVVHDYFRRGNRESVARYGTFPWLTPQRCEPFLLNNIPEV